MTKIVKLDANYSGSLLGYMWHDDRREWNHALGTMAIETSPGNYRLPLTQKESLEGYIKSGYTHYFPEQMAYPDEIPQ